MAYQHVPLGVMGGVNKDIRPEHLDNNTFTDLHNVRFKDGGLVPVKGHQPIYSPPPQPPEYVLSLIKQEIPTFFTAGSGEIHQYVNGIWSNVSRTSPAYISNLAWNSDILNGCVFFNNGVDTLQVLEQADSKFKDSANIPANFTAKVFRAFKNYLFAINVNEGVSQLTTSLRWSDPADPGVEPPSWDVADATTQAGQVVLADTDGPLVDARQLRDQLMIYKTDSVYACQFIGGIYVFSFQKVISDRGILSTNCVAQFENNHFVVGFNDIYVHDGLHARSVSEGKVKDFFFSDLDQDYLENVFCYSHHDEKEIWVCYPQEGTHTDGACNKALVWNWVYNTWTTRDLPNIYSMAPAIVNPENSDTWDVGPSTDWDTGQYHWNANGYLPQNQRAVMASYIGNELYELVDDPLFDGQPFTFNLEKESFTYGGDDNIKHLNHLTPDISGTGDVTIRFGIQNHLNEAITWKPTQDYTIGTYRLYTRGSGRYISTNLYGSTADVVPKIRGLDSFVTVEGEK